MAQNLEILTVTEVAVMLRCSKAHVCNAINGKVKGITRLPVISMARGKLVRRAAEVWLSENDRTRMLWCFWHDGPYRLSELERSANNSPQIEEPSDEGGDPPLKPQFYRLHVARTTASWNLAF